MELLQIATAQFITKCDGLLLQIATPFLLQSATRFITNCDRCYNVRWIYYKLRQVLQSAMIITNCDGTTLLPISGEERCVATLKTAVQQTKSYEEQQEKAKGHSVQQSGTRKTLLDGQGKFRLITVLIIIHNAKKSEERY